MPVFHLDAVGLPDGGLHGAALMLLRTEDGEPFGCVLCNADDLCAVADELNIYSEPE